MPANTKYLTKNPWQQFAKLSAGILGGYIISSLTHLILALILPYGKEVIITASFTFFILWVFLMIIPYLFKNGWKAWGMYIIISIILYICYYFANQTNPFI